MEQNQEELSKNEDQSKYIIPASIVVAGVLIAFAIIYSRAPALPSGNTGSNAQNNQGAAPSADAVKILKIKQDDFVLGSPSAKVAFVEYADFQCPFCGRFFSAVEPQLIGQYIKTGRVALVYRDFAFLGEESTRAAEAARCAGEEGKFWEYHNYLFSHQNGENQGSFSDANLKEFAATLKFDQVKFNACFDSGKYKKAVENASAEGRSIGVSGTPTSFINGRLLADDNGNSVGAAPFATFQKAIEQALKAD